MSGLLQIPRYANEYLQRDPEAEITLELLMQQLGFMSPVETRTHTWQHLEKDTVVQNIIVNAVGSPGLGNPQTVRLAPGSYIGSGGEYAYAEEEFVYLYPDRVSMGYAAAGSITRTPNAWDMVLIPYGATTTLPALGANAQLVPIGGAKAEGSGVVAEGMISDLFAITHSIQIQKKGIAFTDLAVMSDKTWTTQRTATPGGGSVTTDMWHTQQIDDFMKLQRRRRNTVNLLGDYGLATGPNARPTTQGLVPFIRGGGNTFTRTPGSITLADLRSWVRAFIAAQEGGTKYMLVPGIDVCSDMNDLFNGFTQNGQLPQTRSKVLYDFTEVEVDGFTFSYPKYAREFSNPFSLGAIGYNQTCLFLPLSRTTVTGRGNTVPCLELRYLPINSPLWPGAPGGAEKFYWRSGPFADPSDRPVTVTATVEFYMEFYGGTDFKRADKFGILEQ